MQSHHRSDLNRQNGHQRQIKHSRLPTTALVVSNKETVGIPSIHPRHIKSHQPGTHCESLVTILKGTVNFTTKAPEDSEDCLYINVYRPANVGSRKLAVL